MLHHPVHFYSDLDRRIRNDADPVLSVRGWKDYSEASLKVADFSISVYGSSNNLFFGLPLAPFFVIYALLGVPIGCNKKREESIRPKK